MQTDENVHSARTGVSEMCDPVRYICSQSVIGASTAEMLEGTSRGVDVNSLLSLPRPFPSPVIAQLMFHPFPSLLFFPSARKFIKEVCSLMLPTLAREKKASCKSWRGPNTLGPHYLQSWTGRVLQVPWDGCVYAVSTKWVDVT